MNIEELREEILKRIEFLPPEQKKIIKEKIESMSNEELMNFINQLNQTKDQICFFCEVANKRVATFIIYENNHFLAFLDAYPAILGQTLIITKSHKQKFSDFNKEEKDSFLDILKKIIEVFYKIGFKGYNLIINEGEVAGQNLDHFSCYLFPRKEKNEFIISWKRIEAKKEDLEKLFNIMRAKIEEKEEKKELKKIEEDILKFLKERKP